MGDSAIRYDGRRDAFALLSFILVPEVRNWRTLKEDEEEVEERVQDHQGESEVNDDLVDGPDTYSQKENGYRETSADKGNDV